MLVNLFKRIFSLLFIAILVTSTPAFAGDDSSGFKVDSASQTTITGSFDATKKGFDEAISKNIDKLKKASVNIFFTLALISLVWNLSQIMIKGTDFTSIFYELLKFTMMVGFFYWLIDGVQTLISPLLSEFSKFSGTSFGFKMTDIKDLVIYGTDISGQILELKGAPTGGIMNFSISNIVLWFFKVIIAFIFLIVTYVMAMNLMIAKIDFLLCTYVGLFVLGMAGGSWFKDAGISYLKTLLAKALKFYATVAVVSIGFTTLQTMLAKMSASSASFGYMLAIMMALMCVTKLIEVVPQSISSLVGNAGNTDVASASGIAKAGAMVAGAMAGGVAMKMAGRVGGNLAGMASQKFAGSAMGKALGNKVNAFKQSKTGQMLDKVFGDHSKMNNSAEGKLKQIGEIMSKGNK